MKPIYCRTGSKILMAPQIIPHIPQHLIYVEPFAGSAAVFFSKEKSHAEILNDFDKDLINSYKEIKKYKGNIIPKKYNLNNSIKKQVSFIRSKGDNSPIDNIARSIIMSCNGFSGRAVNKNSKKIYKPSNPYPKLLELSKYKSRLKNTILLNKDWADVVKNYDTDKTFFYLDPPYENSKDLYKHSIIDYRKMADLLISIKGKFLMSLNDSPNIRRIFKKFKIRKLKLRSFANAKSTIGSKHRVEILISN